MTRKITFFKTAVLHISLLLLLSSSAFAQSANIVGPTINCQGTPLTLTVNITGLLPPYDYLWTNGATTSTVTINSITLIRVRVTGTNAAGNQQTIFSPWRLFLFLPAPTAVITANGPTTFCDGQSVDLTVSGGNFFSSYQWSTGATTQTITVTSSGTYTATVTNFGGCSSTAEQAVAVFPVNTIPKITPLGPVTFCKPGSVTLEADPGYSSYSWSTGETTQSIVVTLTGSGGGPVLDTITVSYTVDINGVCNFTSDPVLIRSIREPKLRPEFCPNFNMALADSIKCERVLPYSGVPAEYDFEFEETTNPGVTWVIHSSSRWLKFSDVTPALLVGKFYNVRVRGVVDAVPYCYGNPCQIGITSALAPTGNLRVFIDEEDGEQIVVREGLNFGVYPNPSSDVFTAKVFTTSEEMIHVNVFDMTGRNVSSFDTDPQETHFTFGNDLNHGMYFVEFTQGESLRQTVKIIKTN